VNLRYLPNLLMTFRTGFSLLVLILAACAPVAVPTEPPAQQPSAPAAVVPTPTAFLPSDNSTIDTVPAPTEAPTPVPIATSRGPDLEATDPRDVSLASGELQFVEFFRFT